jgi:hypothetical protein
MLQCFCGHEHCDHVFLPPGERAQRGIIAWPDLSDRAIAERLGVDHKTVAAARPTEENSPVPRKGRDGKFRRMPAPREPSPRTPRTPPELSPKQALYARLLMAAKAIAAWDHYSGRDDGQELLQYSREARDWWTTQVEIRERK